VSAAAQQAAKRAIVERALGAPVRELIEASPAFGYRDRARLAVGPGGTLGFHARRSHDIVDVPACPLFGAELARALPALRGTARGLAAGVDIDVQAGNDGVHVNVTRADPTSAAHARREIDRLGAAGVVGLSLAGKPTLGQPDVDVAEPGSPPLRMPADGFAQVGRTGNAALVAAVTAAVGPSPGAVVELYAGSGNLTRHLVRLEPSEGSRPPATSSDGQSPPSLTRSRGGATSVAACDGDPAAIARGARNVPEAAWSLRPPAVDADTVVLDPPREGADKAHLAAAARARRRIVYVSCDPQTLGRDARLLRAAGFELADVVALDLMPQTFHVEVVATFVRAGAK
jgi:23S rRNA (uracil1939-C5)-methyltransferase